MLPFQTKMWDQNNIVDHEGGEPYEAKPKGRSLQLSLKLNKKKQSIYQGKQKPPDLYITLFFW